MNISGDNVMVDLETLGTGNTAVILSIGAVVFNPDKPKLGERFYEVIDPQSCIDIGMKMDVSTVMWWMKQDKAARDGVTQQGKPITEVLEAFSEWYPQKAPLWGNGATFDNIILRSAYQLAGIDQPWRYTQDQCFRTLKNMYPNVKLPRTGTHHNALDDAVYQAYHALTIYQSTLSK